MTSQQLEKQQVDLDFLWLEQEIEQVNELQPQSTQIMLVQVPPQITSQQLEIQEQLDLDFLWPNHRPVQLLQMSTQQLDPLYQNQREEIEQICELRPQLTQMEVQPPKLTFQRRSQKLDEQQLDSASQQLEKQVLDLFWQNQRQEIEQVSEFKIQQVLPWYRIEKIMKADEDVRMIAAEPAIIFANADVEVMDLDQMHNRRTMSNKDVAACIDRVELCYGSAAQII